MIDENTYDALLKQIDDLKAQNERLTDHIETHHKYFEKLYETAVKFREKGGMTSNDFADFVISQTHPNSGERG